jgi:excisionase family DNA binding protein
MKVISTERAAHLLNVSEPFVEKLIQEGKIEAQVFGAVSGIEIKNFERFQKQFEAMRTEALDDLARLGQELDLGY